MVVLISLGLRLWASGIRELWLFSLQRATQAATLCSCYGLLLASLYLLCSSNRFNPAFLMHHSHSTVDDIIWQGGLAAQLFLVASVQASPLIPATAHP